MSNCPNHCGETFAENFQNMLSGTAQPYPLIKSPGLIDIGIVTDGLKLYLLTLDRFAASLLL
ncbi:MAG: hypothetical protein DYH15_07615 [Nitrosomonas sp. PRO4]|nr:hypothetical protein [Nitrosomonas sp. PRO4]